MSTQGKRNFRPKIHFTAPKNWLNDPNGLFFADGKWNLYYQYNPSEPKWGPMYWGHAVSTDLLYWEHMPIALEPDTLGMMFSGSAVYDKKNVSSFSSKDTVPVVTFFTSHGETEQQSMAYSLDGGLTFTKYEGNPVIPNPGIKDFRDPKVFWNSVKNCWSLVLAAGDRVHFYSSEDLKHWEKTGEFGPEGNFAKGVWECPDCFPLEVNGKEKWVLFVSMGMSKEDGGGRTQYFIGSFNGDKFICDTPFDEATFIDDGFDDYAGVTFQNISERIMMAWGVNNHYAADTPTGEFCGIMTLPRKLSLIDTPKGGLRLASLPVCMEQFSQKLGELGDGSALSTGELFRLHIESASDFEIVLENAEGQKLYFGINPQNQLFIDRSKAGANNFSEIFSRENFSKRSVKRFYDSTCSMDLIFDVCSVEIYADNGTRNMCSVIYPDSPYNKISVSGSAKITAYTLNG